MWDHCWVAQASDDPSNHHSTLAPVHDLLDAYFLRFPKRFHHGTMEQNCQRCNFNSYSNKYSTLNLKKQEVCCISLGCIRKWSMGGVTMPTTTATTTSSQGKFWTMRTQTGRCWGASPGFDICFKKRERKKLSLKVTLISKVGEIWKTAASLLPFCL